MQHILKHYILSGILLLSTQLSFGQKVSDVSCYQEGNKVKVSYYLDYTTHTELYYSTDGGATYIGPLKKVSGNIGWGACSGVNTVVWDVLNEVESLVGDNIRFKVVPFAKKRNRTIYSQYATVRVGEIISGKIDGKNVERWKIHERFSSYLTYQGKDIKALKPGEEITILGYIEGHPRLFTLNIVDTNGSQTSLNTTKQTNSNTTTNKSTISHTKYKPIKCFYSGEEFCTGLYITTGFRDMQLGGYIGGYIGGFFIEGFLHGGLSTSETITVQYVEKNADYDLMTDKYYDKIYDIEDRYKSLHFGCNLGYGFIMGLNSRYMLTPYAGIGLSNAIGKRGGNKDSAPLAGVALTMDLGVKSSIALADIFEIYLVPEYNICLAKSKYHKSLIDQSQTIRSWGSGFRLRVGVGFIF